MGLHIQLFYVRNFIHYIRMYTYRTNYISPGLVPLQAFLQSRYNMFQISHVLLYYFVLVLQDGNQLPSEVLYLLKSVRYWYNQYLLISAIELLLHILGFLAILRSHCLLNCARMWRPSFYQQVPSSLDPERCVYSVKYNLPTAWMGCLKQINLFSLNPN